MIRHIIKKEFKETFRDGRFKIASVIILILAAIITPPDIVTQFLIGVPVYFLYEISINIAKRTERKRQKELDNL